MAKRCVSITFTVDPTEYHAAIDTPEGAVELAIEMLKGDADLPDNLTVCCEGHTEVVDFGAE